MTKYRYFKYLYAVKISFFPEFLSSPEPAHPPQAALVC